MTPSIYAHSPRTLADLDRLAGEIAPLVILWRKPRPGPLGPTTIAACNRALRTAQRAFARMPDAPRFSPLPPDSELSPADLAILVSQLLAAMSLAGLYRPEALPPLRNPSIDDLLNPDNY